MTSTLTPSIFHFFVAFSPSRATLSSWRTACLALALLASWSSVTSVRADLLRFDDGHFEFGHEGESAEFTLASRAWNPGPNSARPATGNPASGGATFSIMGAGFTTATGSDSSHSNQIFNYITEPITNLIPGKPFDFYKDLIDQALDVWDDPSGFINLGYVTDGNVNAGASQASGGHLGDIRVAAWNITGGSVLAHAFFPATQANGTGGTIGGDVHIDTDFNWIDNPNATGFSQIDLLSVLIHELGHSLGLGHSGDPTSVMAPNYTGAKRTLSADDIAGIRAIYGLPEPVPEPGTFVLVLTAAATLCVCRFRRFSHRLNR